jgi:diguanylate cyclase (GGDEF)-like protein
VAFVFIDLDTFKPINDTYGHAVGDQLLRHVAERMRKVVRAADTISRMGGDEFVILVGDLPDADTALMLAEKIRLQVAQPFWIDHLELTISCSLGVAVYPEDGTDEATLTRNADQAMYDAKAEGRNTVRMARDSRVGPAR